MLERRGRVTRHTERLFKRPVFSLAKGVMPFRVFFRCLFGVVKDQEDSGWEPL